MLGGIEYFLNHHHIGLEILTVLDILKTVVDDFGEQIFLQLLMLVLAGSILAGQHQHDYSPDCNIVEVLEEQRQIIGLLL